MRRINWMHVGIAVIIGYYLKNCKCTGRIPTGSHEYNINHPIYPGYIMEYTEGIV